MSSHGGARDPRSGRAGARRRRRIVPWLAGLLVLACAPQAPVRESAAQTRPRLVLLYLPCTVNRSFLGPYNPEVGYTPNLDRWAARSVVMTRHQTEAGQSGTSYATLLSGARTSHHGVFINGTIVRDSVELIAETMGANGYEVFAWLNHGIGANFNYSQGVPEANLSSELLSASTPGFQRLLERLRADPDYRALVVSNFTLTHGPYSRDPLDDFCAEHPGECGALADRERFERDYEMYVARENYRPLQWDFPNHAPRLGLTGRRLEEFAATLELAYKANVFRLDRHFGALVDAVEAAGVLDESLIALTADHGEILYRDNAHFQWTHGLQLAPEVLSVPALFLVPGRLPPGRYPGVSRALDVAPTVLGLSGVEPPRGEPFGRDLSAALAGDEDPPELLAFSHSTLSGPAEAAPRDVYKIGMFGGEDPKYLWVGVRAGDRFYKRISLDGENFETRAYDWKEDPEERRNVFDPTSPRDRQMERTLVEYRNELIRAFHAHRREESPAEEQTRLEVLRSLGYID